VKYSAIATALKAITWAAPVIEVLIKGAGSEIPILFLGINIVVMHAIGYEVCQFGSLSSQVI
jgi:hypothetical protein